MPNISAFRQLVHEKKVFKGVCSMLNIVPFGAEMF